MVKRKLLSALFLPSSVVLLPTFITSCNKNADVSPLIKPTTEETTKTIESGKTYADYVFNFNRELSIDDFEFHIEEKARDLITIKEKILAASGKQVTIRIAYFNSKIPTEDTTLDFKLEFKYISNGKWKTESFDCVLKYKPLTTECQVDFYLMDKGKQITYATKKVKINSLVEEPEKPTTEGATFRGWFKDSKFTEKWDFSKDLVTKTSTAIFGIYDYEQLTVSFDVNGGKWTTTAPEPQKVSYGNKALDPCDEETPGCVKAPTRDHYRYKGWYKDTECQDKWNFDTEPVKSTMTLHVGWEPVTYYVTFHDTTGHIVDTQQTVKYNCLVTKPTPIEIQGFTFDGWYTSSSFLTKWDFDNDKVSADIKLYCRYQQNP